MATANPDYPLLIEPRTRMVYSPPANHQKSFPHAGKASYTSSNEIDAGALKLQPPKIRPVSSRKTQSLKRRSTTDGARQQSALFAVTTHDMMAMQMPLPEPVLTEPIATEQTVAKLTQEIVAELVAEADDLFKQVEQQSVITQWETPYNRPAFSTPENIQYTRLASQYLQQGRIEDAERLYKQALVVAERTFPAGDAAIYRAVEDLADFYYRHEKYRQAEPLVARLLKHRVETIAADDWRLIRTVDQLSDIYEKCGEPIHAQALYKLLLARQQEVFGSKSAVCAFTLSRLADSYIRHQHYAPAETLMLTILEIQELLYGRSSIEISTTLQDLSTIYQKLGSYDKAAEMLERLLHVLESIHGEHGLSVASCLLKLADLLTEVDMRREAEPLYRRAQDIYTLSYGDRTAAHSVFKKKFERITSPVYLPANSPVNSPISKSTKDKPVEQEECARFPAISLNSAATQLAGKTTQLDALFAHIDDSEFAIASQLDTQEFHVNNKSFPVESFAPESSSNAMFSAPTMSEASAEKLARKTKIMEAPIENFIPDPSSNLDSILDPLFVTELAERYDRTLELPLPGVSDNIDAREGAEDSFDINGTSDRAGETFDIKKEEVVAPLKQRLTLANTVPGLVTVTKADISFRPESATFDSATNEISSSKSGPANLKEFSRTLQNVTALRPNFAPHDSEHDPVQQRETVKEKPILLPEPFPTSRKKSSRTQSLFPVSAPSRVRV